MNNNNKQLIIFTIVLISLCFISVLIFTLPSPIASLNLTIGDKNNIGDTIGGLTAPIIGIVSSILLYLALSRQTDSNVDQKLKNESDIIFLLFDQLDKEIANFYHKVKKGNEEIKVTGLEGLHDYSRKYLFEYEWEKIDNLTFGTWYESDLITLLIDSFNLIEKRIEISNLSPDLKDLFNSKLRSYYNCKFKIALSSLCRAFDAHPHLEDEQSAKIKQLVEKHGKTDLKQI